MTAVEASVHRPDPALLARVRRERPLIHCISNLVTAADCANILLALGARPVMAQEPAEMAEITAAARCTVLNTGTPDDRKFDACREAGRAALAAGHPVVLDPVGAGASAYRRRQLEGLLTQVRPTLVRANLAEVKALLSLTAREAGVDSLEAGDSAEAQNLARALACRLDCTVLLTGPADCIADKTRCALIPGGSALMERITGAGCMLSVLSGAFLAVADDPFAAACTASAYWKRCSEKAEARTRACDGGCGSFRMALFDAADRLRPEEL